MASSEWSAVESAELQLHVHHPTTKVAATKFMRYMWLLSRLVSLSIEHILSEESTIDGLSRPALLPRYGVVMSNTRCTVSEEVEAQAEDICQSRWNYPWAICKMLRAKTAEVRGLTPPEAKFYCFSCGWNKKNQYRDEYSLLQHLRDIGEKGSHPDQAAW